MDDVVREPATLRAAEEAYLRKDHQAVITLTTQVIEEDQNCWKAWVLRGTSLLKLKQYYPCILNNDRALQIEPNLYHALNNRGAAYMALNLLAESIADLNRANELSPESWEPNLQLGLLYGAMDRLVEARHHFSEAARLSDHYYCHSALGTLLLGTGEWEQGFIEDNKRLETIKQTFPAPPWQGEDLTDKHIMLYTEGGQGDRLLSLRYINTIHEKYPRTRITVKAPQNFSRLIRASFPVEFSGNTVDCDYVCSLLNVPMVLKMQWTTVPRPDRYLRAGPDLVENWKKRIEKLPRKTGNVGLCWASINANGKVVTPAALEELGSTRQVNFISLQYPKRECKEVNLVDFTDSIKDWADTAALIEGLDLVVTMDTGVAHLAGALGKPVWVLVRYSTYWPWLDYRIPPSPYYSIWYPSMRLFRQRIVGDWMIPMTDITLNLQRQLVGIDTTV